MPRRCRTIRKGAALAAAPFLALTLRRVAETMPVTSVPFLDLGRMHAPIRDDVVAEIGELIDSNAFINGPQVKAFEGDFATYTGATRCVGVASGLDALRLGLLASGLVRGDEVIVP